VLYIDIYIYTTRIVAAMNITFGNKNVFGAPLTSVGTTVVIMSGYREIDPSAYKGDDGGFVPNGNKFMLIHGANGYYLVDVECVYTDRPPRDFDVVIVTSGEWNASSKSHHTTVRGAYDLFS